MPRPPPALSALAEFPALARVCQRLGISAAEMDRTMTVDEVLDEVDLQHYLYDCDNEPREAPRPPTPGRR